MNTRENEDRPSLEVGDYVEIVLNEKPEPTERKNSRSDLALQRSEMELRSPRTPKEFEDYFNLRWKILRSPWNQPHESEKDEFEKAALHVGAFEDDLLVGVGRIHAIDEKKAQVRYMAVLPEFTGRGIGKLILEYLEAHAKESGFHSIELNSRDTAVQFYSKQGYDLIKKAHVLYGEVPHTVMRKVIIAEGE